MEQADCTVDNSNLEENRRLRIDLSGPLYERVSKAIAALARANDPREPRVMVRGNELVRMTERGELEGFNRDSLPDELSRVAHFEKPTGNGFTPKDPPANVVKAVLARDTSDYEGLPRVDRVTDVPVLDSTKALITEPGCHAEEVGLYYRPADGLEGVKPSSVELTEDVEQAASLIMDDLLCDFEFNDEASKAHAVAMLLQPFVREFIDGPTPMYGIFAPSPGTGKTLLAQTCLLPGCGEVPATPGAGKDDSEWRKRITSTLLSGSPAIVFDNLHGTLSSAALASALTTGVWRDRILGESREVDLPVRNVWAATANNPDLSDEQARRVVPIFLDPGEIRPSDRPSSAFKHADLIAWARAHRHELVSAALTLIEHWRQGPISHVEGGYLIQRAGEDPRPGGTTLGSYQEWAGVMGGILEAAGIDGFLENRDRLNADANEEHREGVEFLAAWHRLGVEPMKSADLHQGMCQFGGQLHDHLPTKVVEAPPGKSKQALEYWLRGHHRQRIGGYQLMRDEDSRHIRRWYVRRPAG